MSSDLQYKLLSLEISPPADSWEHIASRLDEEFDNTEINLSQKLSAVEIDPPQKSWSVIVGELWKEATPSRVIPFNIRRAVAAAIVIGFGALLFFYMFPSKNDNGVTKTESVPGTPGGSAENDLKEQVPAVTVPRQAIASSAVISRIKQNSNNRSGIVSNTSFSEADDTDENIRHATPDNFLAVNSKTNISIPNDPILDRQGNIIMDEKLVSLPNSNYVTVTSPNGEQTKISKKFLRALSYMNAANESEDRDILIRESSLWKWIFQEWRNKILSEPSFIPSATNFLDIMELKEILQDNF